MIATTQKVFCSVCHERLTGGGECLACLLRVALEDDEDSLVFDNYELERAPDGSLHELGAGSMGVTYRAHDRTLNRVVALKVVDASDAAGNAEKIRARFLREARAAAALRYPNVAGIFQFGFSPDNSRCYYAMELVEGETLESLVRRKGPFAPNEALDIFLQVTRALIAAAERDLIHRDLKPGNIMIARSGENSGLEVKVIDFGLAKALNAVAEADLTHGNFVGTPAFASPEQFAGRPADARSDIYSLGATLWYALTGEVPYPGKTIDDIRHQQELVELPVNDMEKAFALDPDNDEVAENLGQFYGATRRYRDWERHLARMSKTPLAVNLWYKIESAAFKLATGDYQAAQSLVDQVPQSYNPDAAIWIERYTAALYARDYDRALKVIAATPPERKFELLIGRSPESYEEGLIARYRGDEGKARSIFTAARSFFETAQGLSESSRLTRLALCDAALGQKDKAISEGRKAVALLPKVVFYGEILRERSLNLARVYASVGEKTLAIEQLGSLAKAPGDLSYGDLRLNPCWDALRGDPRFEKLVALLEPR